VKLIALDCDGTLIYGSPSGPVDPVVLKDRGYFTVLVSASTNCIGKYGFDDVIPSTGIDSVPSRERKTSLMEVKKRYPEAEEYIYISDNPGDDVISKEVGYRYIHPKEFNPENLE